MFKIKIFYFVDQRKHIFVMKNTEVVGQKCFCLIYESNILSFCVFSGLDTAQRCTALRPIQWPTKASGCNQPTLGSDDKRYGISMYQKVAGDIMLAFKFSLIK